MGDEYRIAFLRFNLPVELDMHDARSSSVGTEERIGLLKSLIRNGHKVKIYSEIHKRHEYLVGNGKPNDKIENRWIPVDWCKDLEYDPNGFPEDEDILLIEHGATNLMYTGRNKEPYIKRTIDVINKFKGLVCYGQWDINLAFPFQEIMCAPRGAEGKWNLTKLGDKNSLFKDKKWVIMTRTKMKKKFREMNNGKRFGYKDQNFPIEFIPASCDPDITNIFSFKDNPKHFFTYCGSDRSNRLNYIFDYYLNHDDLDVKICGKWKKKTLALLKEEDENIEHIGFIPNHADVYKFINDSTCQLYLLDKKYYEIDWLSLRYFDVIRSRCLLFATKEFKIANRYFDDFLIAKNHEDLHEKLEYVNNMSFDERKEICDKQFENVKNWTWDDVAFIFEKSVDKYFE